MWVRAGAGAGAGTRARPLLRQPSMQRRWLLMMVSLTSACSAPLDGRDSADARPDSADAGAPSVSPCASNGALCDSTKLAPGPVYPARADGRVSVTAAQAWPHRASELPVPSGDRLARACVALAGCLYVDDVAQGFYPEQTDAIRARWTAACADPASSFEERAIPLPGLNERLPRLLAAATESGWDCSMIHAARTKRPAGAKCEEGCWWSSDVDPVPTVSCSGTVATLTTFSGSVARDCAGALAVCDPASPTGCTDRPVTRCDPQAKDRCDGDVRLGCNHLGQVSFRDCARMGGTCREIGTDRAECEYPKGDAACSIGVAYCDGNAVHLCALAEHVAVDCTSLGFSSCRGGRCI